MTPTMMTMMTMTMMMTMMTMMTMAMVKTLYNNTRTHNNRQLQSPPFHFTLSAGQTSNGSSVDNSRLTNSLRSLRGDRRRPCTWKWSPRSLSRPQQLRTPQRQGQSDHSDASRLPLSEDPIFVVTQRARTRDKPFYCYCCCCCCYGLPASAGQNHQPGSNKISAEAEICDLNDSRGVDDHQFLTPRSEAPLPRRLLATGRRYHQKLAPSTGLQVTADINSTSPMAVRSGVIIGKGSVKRLTLRSTGNSQIEKARAKSLKMTIVIGEKQ